MFTFIDNVANFRPAPSSKEVLKSQMICYVTGVFAEKLKSAGFVSYNDENLSWYRVINSKILQTVYFYSMFKFPFQVAIGYGMHPLFVPAPIPEKLYISISNIDNGEINWWFRKEFSGPKVFYPGTAINCLNTPEHGAELLDSDLFPMFEEHTTEDSVYTHWRLKYLKTHKTTEYFVDQAINQRDQSIYEDLISFWYWRYVRVCDKNQKTSQDLRFIEIMEHRLDAMRTKNEDEYIAILEERKKKYAKRLETKLKIKVF